MEYQQKIKRILASLDQNDQILKAVALRIDNEALHHAKQFDEKQIFEKNKTFLDGLPIAVKDIIDLQNYPTVSGSKHDCRTHLQPLMHQLSKILKLRVQYL